MAVRGYTTYRYRFFGGGGMSSASAGAYEPECPLCGWILPEGWRLDHDRSRWECRHCRQVFDVAEVLQT